MHKKTQQIEEGGKTNA